MEKSIESLRKNLDSLSMDNFVAITIETLMSMERNEYLENINNIDKSEKPPKINYHLNPPKDCLIIYLWLLKSLKKRII
ncbi:MAG: hypothetical protein V1649_03880 [Patescibacteria group bacterium]